MWLADKWQQWQETRARRYLHAHSQLALDVIRRDPDAGAAAFQRYTEMQAAGKNGPERDTYQYPTLANYGFGGASPLNTTLPKPASYQIRNFSQVAPARRAINSLSNPILELPFQITVRRPLGAKAHETQPEPTDEQQARIVAATEMFLRPNNEQSGREFTEMILEDLIVMGAGPFEAEVNKSDERPLFLWPVDVQSIRLNASWQPGVRTIGGEKAYRYAQGRGFLFGSIGTIAEVKLDDDQLCYPKLNPRTNTPFGYGYLETAFDLVNSYLGAVDFATRRSSNSTPAYALFLGENVTIDQVRRWQHYWRNEVEGYGSIPILGGGRAPSVLSMAGTGKDPLWIQWQEWLVRLIAVSFGLSPMRLGLERDVNRSTAAQGASDDWATIAPVANVLKSCYTHWILWRKLGWRDLEFSWVVRTSDELRQAQILAEQWNADCLTVDEARQIYERPALPDGLGQMTKTAYIAAIQAASVPQPVNEGNESTTFRKTPNGTPFDDQETEAMSPSQLAFLREMLTQESGQKHVSRKVAS